MIRAAKTVAKLIVQLRPVVGSKPEEHLVLARANLMEMQTRLVENASTDRGKKAIIQSLDKAIEILVPSNSSLLSCLFLGTNGLHRIFGHRIDFQDRNSTSMVNLNGAGFITDLAEWCLNNELFRRLTFASIHLTIHELGHAFANELFRGQKSNIIVNRDGGVTQISAARSLALWQESIISAAGPLADMAFSSCLLATSALFNRSIAIALGGGAAMWMAGELLYAFVSADKEDSGDFGKIARRSYSHLTFATIALGSQCALGVFACIKLL